VLPSLRFTVVVGSTPKRAKKRARESGDEEDQARIASLWAEASISPPVQEEPEKSKRSLPLRILLLWAFSPASAATAALSLSFQGPNSRVLASLRKVGPVALLRGGHDIPITAPFRELHSKGKYVLRTRTDLDKAISRFRSNEYSKSDYAVTEILCSGGLWRPAVQTLLDESDKVIMDLQGFTPKHTGAAWEIGQLRFLPPTGMMVLFHRGLSCCRSPARLR
jgi:hypothetical protein